ncbi:hypothetical protein K1Y25_07610 [Mammaliicoccus sciuri]|uniref:hypothetical protein n=1 Tax=Mammaliicoccus sciuri TaxID=1296 RepID=UPI001E3B9089|nr:hypothetical protein [Mammaliicoccus sciuri]MCD8809113.1 hypothetical protein [Mammaliicoccus sciuri]
MNHNNYEQFKFNDSIYNVEVLKNEAKNNNGNIGIYQDNIYCPECGNARLKFTNETSKRRCFLSAIDSNEHIKGCNYLLPKITKKEIESIFKQFNEEECKDKMNALMRQLCSNDDIQDKDKEVTNTSKENQFDITNKKSNKKETKLLKTKSLNKPIDFSIENEDICAYYGRNVKLSAVEKNKEGGIYYLLCISTNIGDVEVFYYLNADEYNPNDRFNIVCIGYVKYKKIQLIHNKKSIKIVKV